MRDWLYYLKLDFALSEVVLNTIQECWDLNSENTAVEAIIIVMHCITIIVTGLSYERTRHIDHSFKDKVLISNVLMNHVTEQITWFIWAQCPLNMRTDYLSHTSQWSIFNLVLTTYFYFNNEFKEKFYVIQFISLSWFLELCWFHWDKVDVKVFSMVTLIIDSVSEYLYIM